MDDGSTKTKATATDDDRAFKREDGWWGVRGLSDEHYFDEPNARRVARQLSDADRAETGDDTDDAGDVDAGG